MAGGTAASELLGMTQGSRRRSFYGGTNGKIIGLDWSGLPWTVSAVRRSGQLATHGQQVPRPAALAQWQILYLSTAAMGPVCPVSPCTLQGLASGRAQLVTAE